jgi:DNA repair protein RecN (Recombination protein N)
MLKSLNVKNFAIIEDLTLNFLEGMTVLTGETGAGKSLIIDTILLLLGSRADSDMIRYGTDHASIEGIFTYNNEEIDKLLDKYGITKKSDITIYREIYETSKKSCHSSRWAWNKIFTRYKRFTKGNASYY